MGRRPARRAPRGLGLGRFRIHVGEDLIDYLGIFDARDDSHRSATGRAGLDIDREDPFQALRPYHRGKAFGRGGLVRISLWEALASPAALSR